MLTTLLFDFSRVIIFPKDGQYTGTLNGLHAELLDKQSGYNVFDHFVLNDELLNYCKNIKTKYSLNIFTTGTLQNVPEIWQQLDSIFEQILSAKDYNLSKFESDTFTVIAKKLGKQPEEILYVDDTQSNIEAAAKAGLQTILYKDNKQLFKQLSGSLK